MIVTNTDGPKHYARKKNSGAEVRFKVLASVKEQVGHQFYRNNTLLF
jgi:hypothetical protein